MIVWLSSYPRSGNTFFRVILNSAFGIKTYSIYNDTSDIGADEATSDVVGHESLAKNFDLEKARASKDTFYIKTHELLENIVLSDSDKVIYLVRDGRESTLSFTKYLEDFHKKENDGLSDVLYGNTPFGSWGEHVRQWENVNKLLIKFEEMTDDPSSKLKEIADYLHIEPLNKKIPTFQELQKINPKFFRSGKKSSWKEHFSQMEHLTFWLRNHKEMQNMGYENDLPSEINAASFQTYAKLFEKEIEALKNHSYLDTRLKQKLKAEQEKNNILITELSHIKQSKHYKLSQTAAKLYWKLKNTIFQKKK